jgi:hypothetical protein
MTVTLNDSKGIFKNIPPGRYQAFAFRSVDATAVMVPETLEDLKEFGTPVEVGSSTIATVTVRVVHPDRAADAFCKVAKLR